MPRFNYRTAGIALVIGISSIQIVHLTKFQFHTLDSVAFQAPVNETGTNPIVQLHETDSIHENVIQSSCFPPRDGAQSSFTTIVYIKLAWVNLHSETFYSFVNYFCSCNEDIHKHRPWKLNPHSIPHFYFGPESFVRSDLRRILQEFNETTCGPILIGTPSTPDVTLHTTTYATDWYGRNKEFDYLEKLNDERHIFICHNDAPIVEGANNVYFLTPLHNRYMVPSFFPPTIVARSERMLRKHPNVEPVFLVLGSFHVTSGNPKRNIESLKRALSMHRDKNFTVHFLGGGSNNQSNDTLVKFVEDNFGENWAKIKLTPNSEADVFMSNVGNADVILPLVDETNFPLEYQRGKRLNSAISWGLGFNKRMVVYRPLAEVFGIREQHGMYWLYDNATHFSVAFGDCLDFLAGNHNR
ncbi:hypothetical protein HJC23_002103 [Cyclotella cryptica]|uniref:Uncharacterized protein n=1 Tax=Cyclotella cryptica TaxID=29204 RepID=A0ABD3P7J5_9STRA|eukprot:CCRYP_017118-RD/>CCRYP_017118-RD protein AED:0.30 eAED:0.30 QI:160/1/1/1/1/1/2/315/411